MYFVISYEYFYVLNVHCISFLNWLNVPFVYFSIGRFAFLENGNIFFSLTVKIIILNIKKLANLEMLKEGRKAAYKTLKPNQSVCIHVHAYIDVYMHVIIYFKLKCNHNIIHCFIAFFSLNIIDIFPCLFLWLLKILLVECIL